LLFPVSRLHKHLIVSGFVAIPLIALVFSLVHREALSRFMVEAIEDDNRVVTRSIAASLEPTLSLLVDESTTREEKELLRRRLHGAIGSIAKGLPILRVNLYQMDGTLTYSSDKELIDVQHEDNPRFQRAKLGHVVSSFRRPIDIDPEEAPDSTSGFVESYIPLRLGPDNSIHGVFEVYADISPWKTNINKFEIRLTIAVSVLLLTAYFLLLFGLRKIENKLEQQSRTIRSHSEAYTDLSSKFIDSQELERKRLSRELHDSLGQLLSALKIRFENAIYLCPKDVAPVVHEHFDPLAPLIQASIDECRRVSMAIRPSMLDDLGLLPTLSWFLREFGNSYPDIEVQTQIDIQEQQIPKRLKTTIYRIAQEALHNVARHSHASRIDFSLHGRGDQIGLSIRDNGTGFNPTDRPQNGESTGIGLESMKERAELSGGKFGLNTTPGQGTTISARWVVAEDG